MKSGERVEVVLTIEGKNNHERGEVVTLIAAYREQGIPLLLGDFLITVGGQPVGQAKKAHLISQNLVIAWTGYLVAAKPVLRDLYNEFNTRRVTKGELEHFLKNYPQENFGFLDVRLIGWVIDDGQHCFRWNSLYSQELFYDEYYYDGSGGEIFEKLAGPGSAPGIEDKKPIELAISRSLLLTGSLITDELLFRRNQSMGFGHAYEILYFDGDKFKYVDKIMYVMIDFLFDENSKIVNHSLYNTYYKYRNDSNHAVIHIRDREKLEIHVNPALFERTTGEVERIIDENIRNRLYVADYHCVLCTFIEPNNSTITAAINSKPGDPKSYLSIEETNEQLRIRINFELLEWMYQTERANTEKVNREKSISNLDSIIQASSEKKEVTPVTIDTNLFAISIVGVRLTGNKTEVENEASSMQATTVERAYDIALRKARLRWPASEGWQHTVGVQEIPFHLTLSHTKIPAEKTTSNVRSQPQRSRKVRKKRRGKS